MSILESIRGHSDLTVLTDMEREELCRQIRRFIVSHVAKTGGHLASNLGVVELTVALHRCFVDLFVIHFFLPCVSCAETLEIRLFFVL